MNFAISIIQIILSVLLIVVILLQRSSSGLGAAFGGGGAIQTTKRGVDKLLFNATIVLSILFFLLAVITLVI